VNPAAPVPSLTEVIANLERQHAEQDSQLLALHSALGAAMGHIATVRAAHAEHHRQIITVFKVAAAGAPLPKES